MSQCPTCGQKPNGGSKAIYWVLGLCAAGFLAVPLVIIVLLAAVAAIGTNASSEFEAIANDLESRQVLVESGEWNTPLTSEATTTESIETTP